MDNQEKFLKYTTEILTQTMNDLHMQVIQYKANARVLEEMIIDQNARLVEYDKSLVEERNHRANLESKYNKLWAMEEEFNNTKHQLNHLETFKRELAASRTEADNLRSQLSMTHTKYEEALRGTEMANKHVQELSKMLSNATSDNVELQNSLAVAIEEQTKLQAQIESIYSSPEVITKIKPVKTKKATLKDGNDF